MKPEKIPNSNLEKSSPGKSGIVRVTHLKEKNKTFTIKDTFPVNENTPRVSLIPKLKILNDGKGVEQKLAKSTKPSRPSSITLYAKRGFSSPYQKAVVDKISKVSGASDEKENKDEKSQNDSSNQSMRVRRPKLPDFARRLTSDPQVFNKLPLEDGVLVNFENSLRQISELWLKTSVELSNTLKNLKNNPSLDPTDFQQEKIKIQLAIQQAKSLTMLKTKSVIAEAKMLLHNKEGFGSELEYFFCDDSPRPGKKSGSFSAISECKEKAEGNQKLGGMGDRVRPRENSDLIEGADSDNFENENSGNQTTRIEKIDSFLFREKDEMPSSQKDSETCTENTNILGNLSQEMLTELSKKNDTITLLNNKIFQLQKTCEEHIQMRNQLQTKLAEYHEKVQWNHVLWKQIGKLKARIKDFQESHEMLESEKKNLEMRVEEQEKEIERLNKLNHLLNQKKYLLGEQDGCRGRKMDFNEKLTDNKVLEEKRNSINVLKMVLNMMIDQENLAQKQIAVFKSKIEELEKATNV